MTQSSEIQNKPQVLITCRTHKMIQKEFPEHYGKPDCPVPVKDFHITLGVMETKLQPLKEEVFNKTQDKVKETQKS